MLNRNKCSTHNQCTCRSWHIVVYTYSLVRSSFSSCIISCGCMWYFLFMDMIANFAPFNNFFFLIKLLLKHWLILYQTFLHHHLLHTLKPKMFLKWTDLCKLLKFALLCSITSALWLKNKNWQTPIIFSISVQSKKNHVTLFFLLFSFPANLWKVFPYIICLSVVLFLFKGFFFFLSFNWFIFKLSFTPLHLGTNWSLWNFVVVFTPSYMFNTSIYCCCIQYTQHICLLLLQTLQLVFSPRSLASQRFICLHHSDWFVGCFSTIQEIIILHV